MHSLNITDNNDYFIYSVNIKSLYSVTVTTSDSTVNYWKECYVYIFTENKNNNLGDDIILNPNMKTVHSAI